MNTKILGIAFLVVGAYIAWRGFKTVV